MTQILLSAIRTVGGTAGKRAARRSAGDAYGDVAVEELPVYPQRTFTHASVVGRTRPQPILRLRAQAATDLPWNTLKGQNKTVAALVTACPRKAVGMALALSVGLSVAYAPEGTVTPRKTPRLQSVPGQAYVAPPAPAM